MLSKVLPWTSAPGLPRGADPRLDPLTVALAGAAALVAATTLVGLFDHYPWTFSAGRFWLVVWLGLWAAAADASDDSLADDRDPGDVA